MDKRKRRLFKAFLILLCFTVIVFFPSQWVHLSTMHRILDPADAPEADCILVLGCGLQPDGSPSPMLRERIETGVELYQAGRSRVLLMSGSTRPGHDEIAAMTGTAEALGVPASALLGDGEGHNTYLSLQNLAEGSPDCTVLIVTHRYHLYRSIYIARSMGLTAYGIPCDTVRYTGQFNRDVREILARDKDFLQCFLRHFRVR